MRRARLAVAALACLFGSGCLSSSPSPTPGSTPASLGAPTAIQVGETASFDSARLELGFVELIEDSRCPSDVVCIAMGAARLRISVRLDGDRFEAELRTDSSPARFGTYAVSLTAVEPYPRSNIRVDPRSYVATVVVTKD